MLGVFIYPIPLGPRGTTLRDRLGSDLLYYCVVASFLWEPVIDLHVHLTPTLTLM
jgi:putative lipase involved disintegration of autophagic bodies